MNLGCYTAPPIRTQEDPQNPLMVSGLRRAPSPGHERGHDPELRGVPPHLGQQLGEVLKQVGAVEVTVVVDVEVCDEAGNAPQLHQSLQRRLLHLVRHLDVLRRDHVHQLLQVHLEEEEEEEEEEA